MSTAPRLQTLPEIEAALWRELAATPAERSHPWRVMALATVDDAGGTPLARVRSVVIREVDVATRELLFFTDARSPKAHQLRTHGRGELLCWSASLSWQLRLEVQLQLQDSGLKVSSRWARMKLSPGAQDYLSPLPPGSAIDAPQQPIEPDRTSRAHFAVVTAKVQSIDWLELHAQGHRRAAFDAQGPRWLVP